jgi:hypothetical protein
VEPGRPVALLFEFDVQRLGYRMGMSETEGQAATVGSAENGTDPQTAAMLAGAEVEKGADEGRGGQSDTDGAPLLTPDAEAQKPESVINPESA